MHDDELLPIGSDEAYIEFAAQFHFDVLGVLSGEKPEHDMAEFREDPGTLEQARWKQLSWRMPDKESSPCWCPAERAFPFINPMQVSLPCPVVTERSLA